MRTFALHFLASCAFSLTATLAHAQTDLERATARDAANSGRAAFDAGQYERAIDSFSRAESLVHAPPHLLFLARAQAKLALSSCRVSHAGGHRAWHREPGPPSARR